MCKIKDCFFCIFWFDDIFICCLLLFYFIYILVINESYNDLFYFYKLFFKIINLFIYFIFVNIII